MLGSNLENLYVVQVNGISVGAGSRDGNAYFVWSNDHGQTQSAHSSGASEWLIGPCAIGAIPVLVWYSDVLVACFVDLDDDTRARYLSSRGGFENGWLRA